MPFKHLFEIICNYTPNYTGLQADTNAANKPTNVNIDLHALLTTVLAQLQFLLMSQD